MSAHYLVKCKIFHLIKVIYDFLPKLDNFEKQLAITVPRNLNFRKPESKELLKVDTMCADTTCQSF